MNLSSIITGVPEYIEVAWLTTPATAGQAIASNTITKLTLNTEVADTGGAATVDSANSRFTLQPGTYYFEATTPIAFAGKSRFTGVLGLYNYSDSAWITKGRDISSGSDATATLRLNGQFTIAASKTFELQMYCRTNSGDGTLVHNGAADASVADSFTAGVSASAIDQRTTIKLWKLK